MIDMNSDFYKKELNVKLTQEEITNLIEELQRIPYVSYQFLNYEKLVKKLDKYLK